VNTCRYELRSKPEATGRKRRVLRGPAKQRSRSTRVHPLAGCIAGRSQLSCPACCARHIDRTHFCFRPKARRWRIPQTFLIARKVQRSDTPSRRRPRPQGANQLPRLRPVATKSRPCFHYRHDRRHPHEGARRVYSERIGGTCTWSPKTGWGEDSEIPATAEGPQRGPTNQTLSADLGGDDTPSRRCFQVFGSLSQPCGDEDPAS